MMQGIEREVVVFASAILTGAVLKAAYHCLLCFRKIISHNHFAINIEDLFFWIGVAIYLFVQIYQTSNGSIRWYFILGVVVGSVLQNFFIRKAGHLYKKIYRKTGCENKKKHVL